jgi:hypothetical protein
MVEFGDLVQQAWEETINYENLTWTKNITQGKADTFPIIGRKRDAEEHTPGERILGGQVEHNEIEITLDKIVVDSVFIAEIDELMLHYDVRAPYARQLGESLSTTYDKRVARMHILASRVTERPYGQGKLFVDGGGPLPNGFFHADVATDPSKMEDAAFAAVEWIKRYDIGGGELSYRLGWSQYLALSKYSTIDKVQWSGSANRASAQVGLIAGIQPKATNHIPNTNVTSGLAKYQGNFTSVVGHISNKMAVGTLARRGMKVILKEQEDRLGTLLIASKFNGHGILRPECSFEVATSDITGARGSSHPDA